MARLRRVAEEEFLLVVLLAVFAAVFVAAFPPTLLVADTWLTLMAGREVWEHGLPSRDELTVLNVRQRLDRPAVGRPAPRLRDARARRSRPPRSGHRGLRGRRVRDRGGRRPQARSRAPRDPARLLPGDPGGAMGMDHARPGLRAPALHRPCLAARVGVAKPVPPRLPRVPDPRRLGERARQRLARRAADDAPRGHRARLEPRPLGLAERRARRPAPARGAGDAVRADRHRALLPPAPLRPAVPARARDGMAVEQPGHEHRCLLRARRGRARPSSPSGAGASPSSTSARSS